MKRRKLNETPQLSAFAARNSLRTDNASLRNDKIAESSAVSTDQRSSSKDGLAISKSAATTKLTIEFAGEDASDDDDVEKALDSEEGAANSSFQSRSGSPGVLAQGPSIILSTFAPNKGNVKEAESGTLNISIAPGERLVILGEYELSVRKGQVTLLGATLGPSEHFYRVFAPSTHSLPVLRCLATDVNNAEIKLRQCGSGINLLGHLSSLFGKLWNDDTRALGKNFASLLKGKKKSTFQILYSSKDNPQKSYLQPVISSPEWNQILSKFPAPGNQRSPIILVCGPKGSGKSTFAKLLANRLLSPTMENQNRISRKKSTGVAILDLDPGQPEYSAQGQLSLVHLQELNLGPPFTHPTPGSHSRIIRAHTVSATTPSFDPVLYMECALDLFTHYCNLLSTTPKCPLIINTPGWVLGTGLEILVELVTKCRPTEVVYMSQDGPQEVVESLREAAKTTPLLTLPSQGSEYTTRTAAHLRTMQAMSYFHLNPLDQKRLTWDGRPLTSIPPWEIKYSGKNAGILGIMCYGEQPPPSLLLEAINGSLLAVVVVDDMAAIPGWEAESEASTNESLNEPDPSHLFSNAQTLQTPSIVHTPKENIPYFNPANAISLSPRHSQCLGLAFLRGVDIPRQKLQILTPISPKTIQNINEEGKSIVLVSGKLDTPGWGYVEELVQKDVMERENRKVRMGQNEGDSEEVMEEMAIDSLDNTHEKGMGVQDIPWVEKLKGSQGRGIGGRVWRVRRDLGRSADGA